jgi:hypothetical protein
MRSVHFFLVVGLAGLLFIVQGLSNLVHSEADVSQHRVEDEISISDSIAQLFVRFHSVGSIVIRGQCTDASFIKDDVPRGPTEDFASLGDALAVWSRVVPRLETHHDANGMWRVSDSSASPNLLKVRINDLRTSVLGSNDAVGAVLGTKEVTLFLRDNRISQASTTAGLAPYDASKLPHSAWHLHGVMVGEAFDAAVKKYPGVWVYTECTADSHRKLVNVRTMGF